MHSSSLPYSSHAALLPFFTYIDSSRGTLFVICRDEVYRDFSRKTLFVICRDEAYIDKVYNTEQRSYVVIQLYNSYSATTPCSNLTT